MDDVDEGIGPYFPFCKKSLIRKHVAGEIQRGGARWAWGVARIKSLIVCERRK